MAGKTVSHSACFSSESRLLKVARHRNHGDTALVCLYGLYSELYDQFLYLLTTSDIVAVSYVQLHMWDVPIRWFSELYWEVNTLHLILTVRDDLTRPSSGTLRTT